MDGFYKAGVNCYMGVCDIPNCEDCDGPDYYPKNCINCKPNYTLELSDHRCYTKECYVTGCIKCKTGVADICTECFTGYRLRADNTCSCDIENCNFCPRSNNNMCQECYPGLFLVDGKCYKEICSISNCEKCMDNSLTSI